MVVEVGSERCDSEGHDTDIEHPHDLNAQSKDQIETLKGKKFDLEMKLFIIVHIIYRAFKETR